MISPVRISCRARPLPTRRGKRCVPPPPGRTPNLTSGCPNFADSEAIRIVHAMAVSQPPPSANPLTAGLFRLDRIHPGELAYIGTGDERFITRSGQDHAPNIFILLRSLKGRP